MENEVKNNNIINKFGKKKIILFSVFAFIIILLVVLFSVINGKGGNVKYNNNKKFLEDKKVEDLLFSNIKCTYDGNDSVISYVIVNKSDKTIHLDEYEVVIRDKDDNILATINPNYDYDLEAGGKFETSNSVSIDLTKATKFDIRLHSGTEEAAQPTEAEAS